MCQCLFLIMGLYALFAAKLPVYGKKRLEGDRARLAGIILIAPTVLTVCYIASMGDTQSQEAINSANGIGIFLTIAAFVIVVVMVMTAPEPPPVMYYPGQPYYPQQPGQMPYQPGQPYYPQPGVPYPGGQAGMPPAPPAAPVFMTLAEAAGYLNFKSEDEVRDLIYAGKLPANLNNGEYRISKDALDRYLNQIRGGQA